jgi:RNA polymerase I-specific transcription initiation factor RRN7
LRHQVWFLIHEKGLPAELETVVLDLWTLRILQLENQIGQGQGYDSQSSQAFSASEDESESDGEVLRRRPREKKLRSSPTLIDNLALCYLGIITLRLPITPGDIYDWITNDKMAYRRAIRHIPLAMREKLPANYHAILDPNGMLKYERFYSAVNDLKISLQMEYGVVWPSLNYPLLLFRFLKELALPLELYDASVRLARYIGYDFILHSERGGKLGIRHLPEAQLAACLVVCTKLIYPFDGMKRYPKTSTEPATTKIDWEDWYKQHSLQQTSQDNTAQLYTPEQLIGLQEKDVFSMSADQLDQYLDWYKDSFIDEARIEQTSDHFRKALYDLFPVDDGPQTVNWKDQLPQPPTHRERLDTVKAVHSGHKPQRVIEEQPETTGVTRPGEKYRIYRKEEDIPENARRFYEAVARCAGLSMDMLVMAVFFTEKKMDKWQVEQRQHARDVTRAE